MSQKTIQYRAECDSCNATGLYVGMGERDGAAVVCHYCKGSGSRDVTIKYRDFDGRKDRKGVTRVFQVNPGIGIGEDQSKRLTLASFGGMPYSDWKDGAKFERGDEMRKFTCPAWFYQCADSKLKPEWDECNAALGRSFSQCPNFANKDACWRQFDRENP